MKQNGLEQQSVGMRQHQIPIFFGHQVAKVAAETET